MTGSSPLLSVAWRILAGLSLLLALGLGVGLVLPGTWEARRSTVVAAPPDSVFEHLDVLERWKGWTPWSDVEVTTSGPSRGPGATMMWDDPFAGRGAFRIVTSRSPERMEYRVDVEGGLSVIGTFDLEPVAGGTRVSWTEQGDFGWNPLMSWAALTMGRVQGAQLEQGLVRLATVVRTGALPETSPR